MKILVIRLDVFGDVLVVSSVLRGLKEKYPNCVIDYWCNPGYDAVLENHPLINQIVREDNGSYDLVLRIDHSNQWDTLMPKVHCRIADVPYHPQEVYFTDEELKWGEQYKGCVALAVAAGWKSRRFNRWPEVIELLRKKIRLVQIDLGNDVVEGIEHPRLDVRHGMAVVNAAGLYLGVDSFFMHTAAACCVPMILVLGATGVEIQYAPCSVALRSHAFEDFWDTSGRYGMGIEGIDPLIIAGEVMKKVGVPVIVQHTDENGAIL